jgi:hypothetical protein
MFIEVLATIIVTSAALIVIGQLLYVADRVSGFFARQQALRGQAAAIEVMKQTQQRVSVFLSEVKPVEVSDPLHPSTFDFYDKMIHPHVFLADMTKEDFNAWIDNAIDPPTKRDLEMLEDRLIECEMYEHCAWLKERK